MAIEILALVFVLAFFAEYIDSTLGMGYGTTLTPLLLFMGFEPLQVVPCILVSELFTGFFAAFMHHRVENVIFDFTRDSSHAITKRMTGGLGARIGNLFYIPKSLDAKIVMVLGLCSIVGTVFATFVALSLPTFYLKLFIGVIVTLMGILIILKHKKPRNFSWAKITGLGAIASFNKGLSGGGYGPLVTSGQILSGVKSKSSIAITSFSEALTCLVGVIAYVALGTVIDMSLAPFLVAGAMLSVPFSAYSVKRIDIDRFTFVIGIATLALGVFTLAKLFI